MRAYLPLILVALAVFTAVCIAYVAWDLTADKTGPEGGDEQPGDADR